jgi:Amt family ammonium transporter
MQLCNGVLCGLVAITPGCGVIDPWAGMLVAILGALLFLGADALMLKLQLDDVVAAVPMHLGCGAMGTLFVGLFAREEFVKDFYGATPASKDLGCCYIVTVLCNDSVCQNCTDVAGKSRCKLP